MTSVSTAALELMRAADQLSGVHPGMTHAEIRRQLDSMTHESLTATYLCDEYKKTRDSARRAEIRDRLIVLVREKPQISRLVIQALPLFEAMTREAKRSRPRKHASDAIRRREASRAYRERRKAADSGAPAATP